MMICVRLSEKIWKEIDRGPFHEIQKFLEFLSKTMKEPACCLQAVGPKSDVSITVSNTFLLHYFESLFYSVKQTIPIFTE
jgi:hypothetical protein